MINAPNKSVVFERLNFTANDSLKLNGNITFRGCNANVLSVAFLSGFELLFESCRVGAWINYDGVCNNVYGYTDDTLDYQRNSSGSLSYCFIDTFDAFNNANVRAFNTAL